MKQRLKNGETVIIRKPARDDAMSVIDLISTADRETRFLARNPDEFDVSVEQEEEFISNILNNNDMDWFVAEYDGKIVAHCSVGLVKSYERYRHRAEFSVVVLKNYWGLGIGRMMLEKAIQWCKDKNVSQLELSVIAGNERAISLYEKFGFKKTGTIPNAVHYNDGTFTDEYLMVLEL